MVDLTPIVEAVIALATALITVFVIPWIKRHITAQDRETMLKWVDIAVAAAEQLYESSQGDAKKAYVLKFLESKGYAIDTEEIENAIEAEVLRLHNALIW